MTEGMPRFSIKFHDISGLVPPECSAASVSAAKRIAMDALNSGAAGKAEIRDDAGNLILEFPDEFGPA